MLQAAAMYEEVMIRSRAVKRVLAWKQRVHTSHIQPPSVGHACGATVRRLIGYWETDLGRGGQLLAWAPLEPYVSTCLLMCTSL